MSDYIDNLNKAKSDAGVAHYADPLIRQFISISPEDANNLDYIKDPLFTGFKIFFHFSSESGLLASDTFKNSALAYLQRIGDENRYNLLKILITTLSYISSKHSWVFTDVTGLDEIYNNPLDTYFKKGEISVGMHETADWKATSLYNIYREIVYDMKRRVWVVPSNLRKFTCSIYIYDPRIFNSASTIAKNFLRTQETKDIKELSHLMFDLGSCEFLVTSGNKILEGLSNIRQGAMRESNLDFSYKKAIIGSKFRAITGDVQLNLQTVNQKTNGSPVVETFNNQSSNTFLQRIQSTNLFQKVENNKFIQLFREDIDYLENQDLLKTSLSNLQARVEQRIESEINTQLARLYLGNAEGFSVSDITNFFRYGVDTDTILSRIEVGRNPSLRYRNLRLT